MYATLKSTIKSYCNFCNLKSLEFISLWKICHQLGHYYDLLINYNIFNSEKIILANQKPSPTPRFPNIINLEWPYLSSFWTTMICVQRKFPSVLTSIQKFILFISFIYFRLVHLKILVKFGIVSDNEIN
jgi:hypothetical protein